MIINQSTTSTNVANRVINFIRSVDPTSIYLGIAKPSPWSDAYGPHISDTNPPKPSPSLSKLDELLTIIRIESLAPALESPCGNKLVANKRWQLLNIDSIKVLNGQYTPSPTHVFIRTIIKPEYFSSDSFRTMGIYSNTQLKPSANPGSLSFPTSFIIDPGVLLWVSYSTPVYRLADKNHIIELIVSI